MSRLVIYTAVIGDYEPSLPKISVELGIEYSLVCFTNCQTIDNPSGFKIVRVPAYFQDNKMSSLYFRCNPHLFFGYDVNCIWIDAKFTSFNLTKRMMDETLGSSPVCASIHPFVDNIKAEHEAVCYLNFEDRIRAETNLIRILNHDLGTLYHFSDNGILFRNLSDAQVRMANESWWEMMLAGIRRSQLGFEPAFKMHGLICTLAPFKLYDESDGTFTVTNHDRYYPKRLVTFTPEVLFATLNPSGIAVVEHWNEQSLNLIRGLNEILEKSGAQVQAETPPDVRLSYRREFFRNSISGRKNILQIGFNDGHDSAIILSNSYTSNLLSIDSGSASYSKECAAYIKSAFQNRFSILWGDSSEILESSDSEAIDLVCLNGTSEHLSEELQWYVTGTNRECLLFVDGTDNPMVKTLLKVLESTGELSELNPRMVSNGQCRLYRKTKQ